MVAGDFLLKEHDEAAQAANAERQMLADIQQVPWKHPEVFDIGIDDNAKDTIGQTSSSCEEEWCARHLVVDADGAKR